MPRFVLATLLVLGAACATPPPHARVAELDAGGVVLHQIRLRVAPADTKPFEALMERCVAAARDASLGEEYDWLCYRESPGRYWVLTFADAGGEFAIPRSEHPLRGFCTAVAARAGADAPADVRSRLAALEYEIEWSIVAQQRMDWSTVDSMSTATHPKARMMVRTVRPGRECDFERALARRTAFLAENGYPLPVEGFVIRAGAPGTALQVVFPRDWPSFHASESFWEFVQALPEPERDRYLALKADLMETMSRAEYHHGDHLPEASFHAN